MATVWVCAVPWMRSGASRFSADENFVFANAERQSLMQAATVTAAVRIKL